MCLKIRNERCLTRSSYKNFSIFTLSSKEGLFQLMNLRTCLINFIKNFQL